MVTVITLWHKGIENAQDFEQRQKTSKRTLHFHIVLINYYLDLNSRTILGYNTNLITNLNY